MRRTRLSSREAASPARQVTEDEDKSCKFSCLTLLLVLLPSVFSESVWLKRRIVYFTPFLFC